MDVKGTRFVQDEVKPLVRKKFPALVKEVEELRAGLIERIEALELMFGQAEKLPEDPAPKKTKTSTKKADK